MSRPEHTLKVEAVVLRHADWGEADRLLWLYTREAGKLQAVAKGVRRLRSRKAGHLEPFTRVALLLARGRDLWIVTQAETRQAYLPLGENLERTAYAAYTVELLDRFTYAEGANPGLYQLLVDTLHLIAFEADAFAAVRYYELRLLDTLGFRPQLFQCVQCQAEIQAQDQFFSALQGGVLCPHCGANAQMARPISMTALKYLRHFQRSPYAAVRNISFPQAVLHEVESVFQHYFTFLLERSLNSPAFLQEIRKNEKR